MNVRPARASKIVSFALIHFSCGSLFSVMLLTLIESIVVYFGGEIKPMTLNLGSVLMAFFFMAFFVCTAVLITRDAIKRVLLVREYD